MESSDPPGGLPHEVRLGMKHQIEPGSLSNTLSDRDPDKGFLLLKIEDLFFIGIF